MENSKRHSGVTFLFLGFLLGSGLVGLVWFLQTPKVITNNQEKATPSNQLRESIVQFQQSKYTPEKSAQEWIKLYQLQRSIAKKSHNRFNPDRVSLSEILLLLPPPPSWIFLEKEMLSQKIEDSFLPLFVKLLLQQDSQWVESLKKITSNKEAGMDSYFLNEITSKTICYTDKPEEIESILNFWILFLKDQKNDERNFNRFSFNQKFPDLFLILGEKKAAYYFEELIKTHVSLDNIHGKESKELLKKIVLEKVKDARFVPWGLVSSPADGPFYEALDKRFPEKKLSGNDHHRYDAFQRNRAKANYLCWLILEGRLQEASRISDSFAQSDSNQQSSYLYQISRTFEEAGSPEKIFEIVYSALQKDPKLNLWTLLFNLGSKSDQGERMLKLVRQTLAKKTLPQNLLWEVELHLLRALLANDLLTEANEQMKKVSTAPKTEENKSALTSLATLMIQRGTLENHPEWIKEGISLHNQLPNPDQNNNNLWYGIQSWLDVLQENRQYSEAERLLREHLEIARKKPPENSFMIEQFDKENQTILTELTGIYFATGRYEEVMKVLTTNPHWGTSDLVDILDKKTSQDIPLAYMAAKSLVQFNKMSEAKSILVAYLERHGGFDPAYALLLEISPNDFLSLMDRFFKRDQFEERPLIWKAQALVNAKQWEEAEKTAKQAIAVDPSDGEQGPGDRMRVYGVLGQIAKAKGNAKESELMEGILKAIRLSENADRYRVAGYLKKAIAMYRESLSYFSDAYCIQSRLARHLAESGQSEEAALHYRKAFELMPDSFGRMESHCFGCERAFGNAKAQNIAEKVLLELMQKQPNKPQIHYLLGYLRMNQYRYNDAFLNYQKAVELDPEYLNAWKRIVELEGETQIPRQLFENAVFRLSELDPENRHGSVRFNQVRDLKRLWLAIEKIQKQWPPLPGPLLALSASRPTTIEEDSDNNFTVRNKSSEFRSKWNYNTWQTAPPPVELILSHDFVSTVLQRNDQ